MVRDSQHSWRVEGDHLDVQFPYIFLMILYIYTCMYREGGMRNEGGMKGREEGNVRQRERGFGGGSICNAYTPRLPFVLMY